MGKRAWQYPEATGITNDDVILLDSPTGGSRSIKANKIGSVLINKTLTERGTFDATDDNVDGYKKVTVDVPYTDVEVASGPVASWDDGEDLPLKSLTSFIEPQQEGSGDPSPENVRPISGWDEANVNVVGKNILGGLPLANAIVNAGGTLDTVNKTVSFTHGNSQVNILDKVKLKERTKYTFILTYSNTGDNNCLSLFYKTSGTRYPINLNNSSDTKTTIVYTTSAVTIDKLVLGWVLDVSTKIYYEESGLFEGELTASDFEAYNGHTYTIDLDGTRYGGTLDVVNGVLTLTHGYIASYNGETLPSTWISDRDVYEEGTTPTIGAEVCYELATPLTIQLTPTAVKSLIGSNNVWADTGDVDVEYQKIWVRPSA